RGVGGTVAINMEPRFDVMGTASGSAPTATDYIVWARRAAQRELDSWQPSTDGYTVQSGGFGITTDVVTLADAGYLVSLKDVGFAILFPGPMKAPCIGEFSVPRLRYHAAGLSTEKYASAFPLASTMVH